MDYRKGATMTDIEKRERLKRIVKEIHIINSSAIEISRTDHGLYISLSYKLSLEYSKLIGDTYFIGYKISWDDDISFIKGMKDLLKLKRFVIGQTK